jgi:hypothetical protein
MATRIQNARVNILWDDGVVFVYEFWDPNNASARFQGALGHLGQQVTVGTQVQQNATTQSIQQVTIAADPGCWIETLKNCDRNSSAGVDVYFEDGSYVPFAPQHLANSSIQPQYQLYAVYSIAG